MIRYYRQHPQLGAGKFQVWDRDTSFAAEASADVWDWPMLRQEMEAGVTLVPVQVPWKEIPVG